MILKIVLLAIADACRPAAELHAISEIRAH